MSAAVSHSRKAKTSACHVRDFRTVKQIAHGRWSAILVTIGIPADALTGKHGPCPACGGKDRFRFTDKDGDGGFICGGGGQPIGGDGFRLLQHLLSMSPREALKTVADVLGLESASTPEVRKKLREAKRKQEIVLLEQGLVHELHVLQQYVSARVVSRELKTDAAFRRTRPEWTPSSEEPWQRELLAVKRIQRMLGVRYD